MNKRLWSSTLILASACFTMAWDGSTFDGSDWLVNGNAELTGTGTKNGPEVGWNVNFWGNNNRQIDVVSYSSISSLAPADRPANAGNNFFMGGQTNSGSWFVQLTQLFSFTGNVPACNKIDAGNVPFKLSGYLGNIAQNYYAQTWTQLIGKFTLANGSIAYDKIVGDLGNGHTTDDSSLGGKSAFRYVEWSGLIPSLTRKIEIFVILGKNGDGWDPSGGPTQTANFAAADNIKFNVGTAAVPEPMSMIALGLGAVGLIARRRRK